MFVVFFNSKLEEQIPTLSFVNRTSHHRTKSGKPKATASWYALELEDGNKPENPPLATTSGEFPEQKRWKMISSLSSLKSETNQDVGSQVQKN